MGIDGIDQLKPWDDDVKRVEVVIIKSDMSNNTVKMTTLRLEERPQLGDTIWCDVQLIREGHVIDVQQISLEVTDG